MRIRFGNKILGTLAVEDFEILELKYEMDILIGTGKYDEAEEKLSELKNMIDCDDGMNAMAIEIYQMSLELSRKLSDALNGADIFVGVSAKGCLKPEMIKVMNKRSIILAMANPIPEFLPA